jgi:Flp pilus assembly pilin Flp
MLTIIQAGVTYLRARFSREDGAVTTEYGLLIVFIALAVIVGMVFLAEALLDMFNDAGAELQERP